MLKFMKNVFNSRRGGGGQPGGGGHSSHSDLTIKLCLPFKALTNREVTFFKRNLVILPNDLFTWR